MYILKYKCINNIIFVQLVINELITCFTRKSDIYVLLHETQLRLRDRMKDIQ